MPRPQKIARGAEPDALEWALPPVRAWFASTFGDATPAQRGGWPSIAGGRHTLICAPTGTGKTLAGFLAGLDAAWRSGEDAGTKIVYVSPLKALNRDVAANLEAPLAGIVATAEAMGTPLRPLSVGVRTGDTTAAERRSQAKNPPDIVITTPESLHLLLSSGRREALRGVSHVIVDEIHDLCSSKRGASLALLLERLQDLAASEFVRIGLSATLEPLEAVARFLGGWRAAAGGDEPRPVTIVDAGVSKRIELRVLPAFPAGDEDGATPASLEDQLLALIRSHRTTIVFANNRGEVERLAARLARKAGTSGGLADGRELVRPHHGSLSLERRRETEDLLKRGGLASVVATASLELGIDVGSVDLVCLVGSPGGVARGLQRVGRAGHAAGAVSRACLFGRGAAELTELASLADAMTSGAVEPVRIPRNCLDVLAQQVVAAVAAGPVDAADLYRLVRRADPFRTLPVEPFEAVLAMLSGRSDLVDVRDLRPRIRWDTVANRLEPLPGTRRHALMGGGTIPDSGQVPVYLDGGPRLGEFDEAFVMERRPGDAVQLGTSTWLIRSIDARRVVVAPGPGRSAVLPFWRGEGLGRSPRLGERLGAWRREVAGRLGDPSLPAWIADRGSVAPEGSRAILDLIRRQVEATGRVPDDRTVLVESFLDQAGVRTLALLSPFGSRFHLGVKLVLQGVLRDRLGISAACQHADDGVLLQFPGLDDPPTDLIERVDPDDCTSLLLGELRDSSLFTLRFRQVAARALLTSNAASGGRMPLWFQRLRAEELLGQLGGRSDHPLIAEAVRECLEDDLDLAGLRAFFARVRDGSIAVVFDPKAASPSPMAAALAGRALSDRFAEQFERRARRRRGRSVGIVEPAVPAGRSALALPAALVDPDAVRRVDSRLRGQGRLPRTPEELAELLRFCGDLDDGEVSGGIRPMLALLADRGVAERVRLAGPGGPLRWISAEARPLYASAFGLDGEGTAAADHSGMPDSATLGGEGLRSWGIATLDPGYPAPNGRRPAPIRDPINPAEREAAIEQVVRTFLRSRALVGADEVAERYGIEASRARAMLERLAASGDVVAVPGEGNDRWGDRRNVEDVRRISVAIRRQEAVAVEPEVFADLLLRHQHAHPAEAAAGREGLSAILRQLRGLAAASEAWEGDLLPRRLSDFSPGRLDELLRTEEWSWRRAREADGPDRVAFVPRDFGRSWPDLIGSTIPAEADRVLEAIRRAGRVETEELAGLAGVEPDAVGPALAELSRLGLVGGDHFDPIRRLAVEPGIRAAGVRARRGGGGRGGGGRSRRGGALWETSGVRWSAFDGPGEAPEGSAWAWALALLDRFGVLCRETAALDPWAPPWSQLREALDASELRGEVRRGYFVAGLSGVQFASGPFADRLARHRPDAEGGPIATLIATADPANLYGSGGPFAADGLGGGTVRIARSWTSQVAIVSGKPALVADGFGRTISTLPWADDRALAAAVARLPGLAGPSRRVLKVREIDGVPAWKSRLAGMMQEVGFVRDPPGLAYYAGW